MIREKRREDHARRHNRITPTPINNKRILLSIRRRRRGLLTRPIPNRSTRRPRGPLRPLQGSATRRGRGAWADCVVGGIGFSLDSRVQPIKHKRGELLQHLNGWRIVFHQIRINGHFF